MENNSAGSLTNGDGPALGSGDGPAASLPSSGVHHHLPQIPTMDKGIKKAYSKAKQMTGAGDKEKSENVTVTHVEGTGAVLKISETDMDVENLLDQVEEEAEESKLNGDSKPEENSTENKADVKEELTVPKKRGRKPKDTADVSDYTPSKSVSVASPSPDSQEHRVKRVVKRKVPKSEFQENEKSPKEVKVQTKASPVLASAEIEAKKPAKYVMGDMLWAKVGGHPWWPCMVSDCPYTFQFTKLSGSRMTRMYHVQYFGNEGERGWITESATIPFKGLKEFLDHADEQIQSATKKLKPKVVQSFRIQPTRKSAWDIGVAQATEAFNFDNKERQEKCTFVYDLKQNFTTVKSKDTPGTPPKKRGRKRKVESDETSPSSVDDPNTPVEQVSKRQKLDSREDDKSDDSLVKALFTRPKTVKYEASFDTFYNKHEESVLDEHPDWSGDEVREHLSQQWSIMTEKQKARYKTKFTVDSDTPSSPGKRSPRVSKPSIKKLEAEEDKKGPQTLPPKSTGTRKSRRQSDMKSDSEETEVGMETDSIEAPAPSAEELEKPQKQKKTEKKDASKPHKESTKPPKSKSRRSESVSSSAVAVSPMPEDATEETESAVPEGKDKKKSRKSKNLSIQANHDSDSGSEKSEPRNDLKSRVLQSTIKSGDGEYELDIFKLHATSNAKRENICVLCEQPGQLLECQGACQGHFHASCLKISDVQEAEFRCNECETGNHTCFGCKETSPETRKCSVSSCGKFYHEACFKKYPQSRIEGKSYFCPLHTCATCAADNPKNPKSTKGRLLRCVRCPVAYHAGDYCIAAGAINLAGNHIVCSKHFQPNKTQRHHSHVNVSWCFQCSKGGTLLCCESCPAAYHPECLKLSFPEGSWYCQDCSSGKKPLYGDLIWIKIGNYRWWPGEICHPRNVPLNIQEKTHQVGEFPVRFFGSHDFYWTHQGRVFLFQEGDKGSRDQSEAKGLAKIFGKGVIEATEAFKIWQAAKANKEQLEKENNSKKPAPFKFVKTNIPIGNVQINKADLSEIPRCECKPDQDNPCSNDSDCLNRMLMYECHPQTCPAAEKCQNQRFTKREYPTSEATKTPSRGWGLYTKADVKKGQFVNEYVGDLVDEDECRRRIKQAHEDNITNFYMLTLDKNRVIDAGPKGNLSRFMNHSCQPNCETQKWMVNGDVRVGLFALNDISAGSELTFNYNLECLGNEKTVCACGASNCSGFLGVRPKSAAAMASANRVKEGNKKKKRKKKMDIKKEHDDDCFRCEEGGELVMCDHNTCPKVYHLQCLNLTKPPTGKWLCPWHHCDDCGKSAAKRCSKCPNSYCSKHIKGNIFDVEGRLYCHDHDNILSSFAPSRIKTPSGKIKDEPSSNESSKASTPLSDTGEDNEDSKDSTEGKGAVDNNDNNNKSSNGNVELDTSAKAINFKTVKKILTSGLNAQEKKKSNLGSQSPSTDALFPKNSENLTNKNLSTSKLEPRAGNRSPALNKASPKVEPTAVRQRGRPCKTKAKMIANMKQGAARMMENKPMTPPQNLPLEELKVAPMFDDSDEGETDLVIDIPQF